MQDEVLRGIKDRKLKEAKMPTKNHLLVIGIDEYEDKDLKLYNAVKDAKAFEALMHEKYGFKKENITSLYNEQATKENILSALDKLSDDLTKEDNLIFYFSGHGEWIEKFKRGYWLPVKARKNMKGDYLINTEIQDFIKICQARHVLGIVDACYSASLLTRGTHSEVEKFYKKPSRYIMTSGSLEPVSDGLPNHHSPFAKALLTSLEYNDKAYFSALELWLDMRPGISNNTKATPLYRAMSDVGDMGGEFFFLNKKSDEIPSEEKIVNNTNNGSRAVLEDAKKEKQKTTFKSKKNLEDLSLSELKVELKVRVTKDMGKTFELARSFIKPDASIYNTFIQTEGRYNRVEKDKLYGMITDGNANVTLNQIRHSFNSIIDDLEEEDLKR